MIVHIGRGWRTKDVRMLCGSGLWRNMMKGWVEFSGNISFRIGDGRRVSFRGHKWCGHNFLKTEFPSIYRVSCQKELTVQQI